MPHISMNFIKDSQVSLSEGGTLILVSQPTTGDGDDINTLDLPVPVAFKIVDLMMQKFPDYFPTRKPGGE